ncbi:beta-ketoacyl synthase N-terminal-like domain-containing protein [Paenibacillus donghaensis]|uniref:Beta-ketoacyl synthase N-terminal domain-containing protein n=1 Tax=Paenibacillus donghaensis TaxID=414771 RepID=A0A2Z2K659_9BACL|nr:beta-ketoacyl synthase N-terminal-like domain-containing protein [Paenibacillus donghaensis]ASA20194.1 hypothetical protein B9T62_04895 [Paenibacillus donghaensis]
MSAVWITGIGMISRLGCTLPQIWEGLCNPAVEGVHGQTGPVAIPELLPRAKMRRMDRYAYMTVYTSQIIADEAGLENFRPERTGTIFNTGYGPLNTNLAFGESVAMGDPDCASPMLFSSTVSNACVGHVAIQLGLKGVSTVLMGSNHIGYSLDLLLDNRADAILTGGVEEYCEPLFRSFKSIGQSGSTQVPLSEGAATLLLERSSHVSSDRVPSVLCEVLAYSEGNLGGHPLVEPELILSSAGFLMVMSNALEQAGLTPDRIQLVIKAASGTASCDEAEAEALDRLFVDKVQTCAPKHALGETLGASLAMNTAIGALCLQKQEVPQPVLGSAASAELHYVLVNAYDVSGNLTSLVLGRAHE